ncbi:MRC [Mytilus coruscus]|uniref:MRC n=1 Tax=Mytilus coruscus TaxID=42192 RepID=A0A6J8CRR9_MYTCO|nr:MRC [Mytilus coruscus]
MLLLQFVLLYLFSPHCIDATFHDIEQQFRFVQGSANIQVAKFLEEEFIQNITVRSRIQCYLECTLDNDCLSLAYRNGVCETFATYSEMILPVSGVHYLLYREWCDVHNGFIYIRHINTCYKVVHDTMVCELAMATCSQYGANLIEINNHEKQLFFEEQFLRDESMNGTFISGSFFSGTWWLQSDGKPFQYTNWDIFDSANIQPNNFGNPGDCLAMEDAYWYLWHDVNSNYQLQVICEMTII